MPRSATLPAPHAVLIAAHDEFFARSLESVLVPAGYTVRRAYNSAAALEQARSEQPDAVILGTDLAEPDPFTACRLLRDDPRLTQSTPIFLVHPGPSTRLQRLEALRSGACDLWGQPLDQEEFLLRLGAHLRTKADADRARGAGLIDAATGLYNTHGLVRRLQEELSEAARRKVPVSLVVFGPDVPGPGPAGLDSPLAAAIRHAARRSDAVAHVAADHFAVAAPTADPDGVMRLSERVFAALEHAPIVPSTRVGAGYDTLGDVRAQPTTPETLLEHALAALQAGPDGARVRRWRGGTEGSTNGGHGMK